MCLRISLFPIHAQEQAIQASHQALVPRGVLFSGTGPVGNGGGRTAGGASASGEGSMVSHAFASQKFSHRSLLIL